jgi:hypothetical protein
VGGTESIKAINMPIPPDSPNEKSTKDEDDSQVTKHTIETPSKKNGFNLAADVKALILSSTGRLLSSDVVKKLGFSSWSSKSSMSSQRSFYKNLSRVLRRLVEKGLLADTGRPGGFIIVNRVAEAINWRGVGTPTPVNFKLPLNLHDLVTTYAGNVIVVGGSYNAGKTVFALNVALLNLGHWNVNYLSSEMNPEELAGRLLKFQEVGLVKDVSVWDQVKFRQRRENFHQVLDPEGLNIIDFLEMSQDFYLVTKLIGQIHEKLNQGVAVICIQKDPKMAHARGGAFTLEKARFGVSIDPGKLTIMKAKCLKSGVKDPMGQVIRFTVEDGARMVRSAYL